MAVDMPPMTLEDAQRLYERPAYVQSADVGQQKDAVSMIKAAKNEAQKARARAVLDTGQSVGLKAGMSWQLSKIDTAVSKMTRDLDSIYAFGGLMIQQRVVPPVITEARNVYNQDGDLAVRLSGAYYKIERNARFSSLAPSWREYLTFPKATLDRNSLASLFMPTTDEERAIWRVAVRDGWEQGVEQANLMLEQAMDRMNRDFIGMTRFHRFVIEGKITVPAIATEEIPVTRENESMAVDETLLRITTLPEFNGKITSWKGVVISEPAKVQVAAPVPVVAVDGKSQKAE